MRSVGAVYRGLPTLVLASQSPRRKQLLGQLAQELGFEVKVLGELFKSTLFHANASRDVALSGQFTEPDGAS